jgi:membrane-bound lytic murein transglycosylase MltF
MYSAIYNIDPNLVHAIVRVESSYNYKAIGKLGERGLMQIRPEYTTVEKYKLFIPRENIKNGIEILVKMKKICEPRLGKAWPICFNLGPSKALKIRNPEQFSYYKKIMKHMRNK